MQYDVIINYASILMFAMAVLVFATNIIVEVFKSIFPKLPTSILAVLVALLIAGIAVAIAIAHFKIAFMWYYAPATIVLGLFVAYAAMFGFDKFTEAFDKLKAHKN